MWVKVDDCFPDHPKVAEAGRHLGRHGIGRVLALWLYGLAYCNRNETNGIVPVSVLRAWTFVDRKPLDVATVMALPMPDGKSGLLERHADRYVFHDYLDFQPGSDELKAKRAADRKRKQSRWNPSGIRAESAGIPDGPIPIPVQEHQDHRGESARGTLRPVDNRNPRVLVKLAYDVLHDGHAGVDAKDELKARAGRHDIGYDGEAINTALDQAESGFARRRQA